MFSQSQSKVSNKQGKIDPSMSLSTGRSGAGHRDTSTDKTPVGISVRSSSLGRVRGRTGSEGSGPMTSSFQGPSRTSPLNLPMDSLQSMSMSCGANQGYVIENLGIPGMPVSLKSPIDQHSPGSSHGRASSLTNVARDRSLDRIERDHILMGERSLDRHLDRIFVSTQRDSGKDKDKQNYSRDRSLDRDREYPHMGARSLERDHHPVGRSRSSERNGEYGSSVAAFLSPSPTSQSEYRNSLLFELQVQISELHKECAKLQRELDATKDKLSSSMNSIKTFWSPELKKERSLRKEETAKCNLLNEQLKVTQAELKKHTDLIVDLQSNHSSKGSSQVNSEEYDTMKKDKDRQGKEILILRKTVDEMELRIETQKQTLAARDESIKKLLEMLQSKGLATGKIDEDRRELEHLRSQVLEEDRRRKQLENILDQRDGEITKLKDEMGRMREEVSEAQIRLKQQPASTHTMQAMLEAKDSRIAALEKEIQGLEDKLLRFREDGSTGERRDGSLKNNSSVKDKMLRSEVDNLKEELAKKHTELTGLQMKVETLERQHTEQKQYILVLKEQITTKELHSGMLQADIEDLQDRMKEKEFAIDKKSKQSQSAQAEKRRMETELTELRDHLDIKDRKVSVLHRKIENLEDLITEKEEQINQLKMRISTTFTDSSDSAISSLEESLTEKEKQIERLREQREKVDKEHQEELDSSTKCSQDLKTKLEGLNQELNDKQTEMCELREEATELRAEKFKTDTKMRQLESQLAQKISDLESLQQEVKKSKENAVDTVPTDTSGKDIAEVKAQVLQIQDEAKKNQAEVDRLLEILKESENEKNERDNQIKDMQEIIKEYKQKMGTLKRNQNTEKKKNAQLLEEARKSEKSLSDDASQLQTVMVQKGERIEELEEALRESVRITAEREMDMAAQQMEIEECKKKIEEMKTEIESLQHTRADLTAKVSGLTKQMEEKEMRLRRLHSERHKHLEEVFEMKQEAIQAAISEKDANIALLEMTSTKKQRNTEDIERLTSEKEKLANQLKELTQSRMRLLHKDHHGKESGRSKSKKSVAQKLRSATPEQVDPYVLTAPDASLMES